MHQGTRSQEKPRGKNDDRNHERIPSLMPFKTASILRLYLLKGGDVEVEVLSVAVVVTGQKQTN